MKNKMGFYIKSAACKEAEDNATIKPISIKVSESIGWELGVEWHHSGSNLKFFPKNEEELKKVLKLKEKADKQTIKSKAAFWREVAQKQNENQDFGFGKIEAKLGKFGWFCPDFGEAEKVFGLSESAALFLDFVGL